MALISTLRCPKIARSVSLERKFDSLQSLEKYRSLNSHVFYLKSGPQCLSRKEFNAEKETFLITAGVEKPQYKKRKRRREDKLETLQHRKEKERRRHQREQKKEQRQKY
ncbi:hypothetical protein NC653_028147 [Populus alba x Populus x berolinensis]|uniref:Uncharacterized protein n=1 Tax=Populus alba x Populus x berolinensis TaxID=444605 RepID=A0AAD6M9K8_9ROSI|nr:hypothetical protein NC653_028147 [Populus alba x Populus x berolinensis]